MQPLDISFYFVDNKNWVILKKRCIVFMSQRIVSVFPGSLAARHGIEPVETLISIGGTPVLDLVDYQ